MWTRPRPPRSATRVAIAGRRVRTIGMASRPVTKSTAASSAPSPATVSMSIAAGGQSDPTRWTSADRSVSRTRTPASRPGGGWTQCRPSLASSTDGRRTSSSSGTIRPPQGRRARRDAEGPGRKRRLDVPFGPDEPASQDGYRERRHHVGDRREDHAWQDLDDVGRRAGDRRDRAVELTPPNQQEAVDRRHSVAPDRCHELAVRADDRVDAGGREPPDARSVGPDSPDEVGMDGDELARVVDAVYDRDQRQTVAEEQEHDRCPAPERSVQVLGRRDRRTAWLRGDS